MHEAGIVDRILEIVLARAAEAGTGRITRIHLEAGPLSGVADEALRFHWAEHAAGTKAEGADLVVVPTDDLIELRLVSFEAEDAAPGEDAAAADVAPPDAALHAANGDDAAPRDAADATADPAS